MKYWVLMILALFAAGGAHTSSAQAQSIGFAGAIKILGESCGADIQKYCKNVNLGDNRIQACLAENQDKLSQKCKTDYVTVYKMLQNRFAAQEAVGKICDRDAQNLCKLVKPGKGHLLKCLLKAEPSVSSACNQAITNAGYR